MFITSSLFASVFGLRWQLICYSAQLHSIIVVTCSQRVLTNRVSNEHDDCKKEFHVSIEGGYHLFYHLHLVLINFEVAVCISLSLCGKYVLTSATIDQKLELTVIIKSFVKVDHNRKLQGPKVQRNCFTKSNIILSVICFVVCHLFSLICG